MSMPEQLVKNAMTNAGSAGGKVFATKIIDTFLGDVQIDQPAQEAIQAMQQHFFSEATLYDFITPLRRTGIYLGKDPFKKAETFTYLGTKIEVNHRRLLLLTNMNLKEAATLLWDLHCQIALHIMYRRSKHFERSDANHSYVLMYLQESISSVIEQICNKPDLTDDDIVRLKIKITEGVVEPFHSYIQNTQSEQSSGARRTAIHHTNRKIMEKVCKALDRFIIEKPLRTSIDSLQQTSQAFSHVLKQMLLAIVLVERLDGEKQQEAAWVLQRKIVLARITQCEQEVMWTKLQEERAMTTGYQGKSGVLYINPFAERARQLILGSTISQDKAYFHHIMSVFASVEKSDVEQTEHELQGAAEQFSSEYAKLINSDSLLLKDILIKGDNELGFINTALILYRQSHELARFMSALQHFMQLVGKLGLYNNTALHTQLTHLIQSASTAIDENLARMYAFVRQGSEAQVGGWLNPIDEMLQQLKRQGDSITRELQSFQGHFAKIIDPHAMQTEFNKSKMELLRAALGLGHASQIDKSQMNAIALQIRGTRFEQFTQPVASHQEEDTSARLTDVLNLVRDLQQHLDTAETEVSEIRTQYESTCEELARVKSEMNSHEQAFKVDGARLQSQAVELSENIKRTEVKLVEIDQVVNSFGQTVKQQLTDLNQESIKDVEEANRLMEAARANLASSSSNALSDQMTLLSRLKGRLEERQKSYQKLVESVTAFQAEYTLKRGAVSLALINVQEVAKDIDRTVLELVAKINALTDVISCLRHTLDEKDKQLALQQRKLIELEAQLSALRGRGISQAEGHKAELETVKSSESRFSHVPGLSFIKGINKQQVLNPEYRIQRAIEVYENDIQHGRFVRNKDRKVVKYAVWSMLYNIVFRNEEIPSDPKNIKELILAAIRLAKESDFSIRTEKDNYVFSDIVKSKNDDEIYLEFLKGKESSSALNNLQSAFVRYLEQRKQALSMSQLAHEAVTSTINLEFP